MSDWEERRTYRMLQAMVAVVSVTAIVSFLTIRIAPQPAYAQVENASPYGYTVSLVLFLVPSAILFAWFWSRRRELDDHWKAFRITFTVIVVVWSALDVLLANVIFDFPNHDATLGLNLPGYDRATGWGLNVPIEEFIFYISGSAVILLLYIWSSEVWYAHYTQDSDAYREYGSASLFLKNLFHPKSLIVGLGLVFLGIVAKYLGPTPDGFPLYFTFLVLVVMTPTAMCFEAVARFLNLRAFLFTIQALLAISILWEVTLGLPYGWWGYESDFMLGWFITPWSNLPVEAPLLWLAAAWSNIGIYEVAKIFYAVKDRRLSDVLFTKRATHGSFPHGGGTNRTT